MNTVRIAALALVLVATGGNSSAATVSQSELPASNLKTGDLIPNLRGTDQFGKPQDFNSLKGPNGLVLLFFRSADW